MGISQPLSQFNVEGLRNGKDVEFLLCEQSCPWSFTTREAAGSRKTRAPAGPNSAAADTAQRASSHDGSLGRANRYADRGNSRTAPKGRGFFLRPDPDRAGVLSRFARLTQNQRQQTYASLAHSTRTFSDSNLRARITDRGERSGISDTQRRAAQRHQPVAPSFKTGRLENRLPSLSWHTLRRTHATLLQTSGGSLKDAQAQLGHSRMSTTLEVYTLPIPAHLRLAVENLSQLVTNGDELHQSSDEVSAVTKSVQ
jgi:Phage integrase family